MMYRVTRWFGDAFVWIAARFNRRLFALLVVPAALGLGGCPPPPADPQCSLWGDGFATTTICDNIEVNGWKQRAHHYCADPKPFYPNHQYGAWRDVDGWASSALVKCEVPVTDRRVVIAQAVS